jgi:lipopolysaccharide transport system ATP-binding protein
MSDLAIRVEGLGKRYRIGQREPYKALRDVLARAPSAPYRWLRSQFSPRNGEYQDDGYIWALRDVSFEVRLGEVIGIIGRNGAGKSTLLKILSRITKPTKGHGEIYGRVGSLLEVGTGFHPELTGRENVYLNGAILGMKRDEIKRKFDEIVAFAEIEQFLDTPVKRYSSGMYVRLAFAVAANLEPEILLVDEVLAVGDADFQKKCLGKMGEVSNEGRTVFFVSHNMATIQALCDRSILLASGELDEDGLSVEVVKKYLVSSTQRTEAYFDENTIRSGNGSARFVRCRLIDQNGQLTGTVPMGHGVTIELEFECDGRLIKPIFGISLRTSLNQQFVKWKTQETYGDMPSASRGGIVRLHIERLDLLPGLYYLVLGLSDGNEQFDLIENALELEITPWPVYPTGRIPSPRRGIIFTPCSWSYEYS